MLCVPFRARAAHVVPLGPVAPLPRPLAAQRAKGQDESRRDRLKAALRENLKRRKGQDASRRASPPDAGEQPVGKADQDKDRP